jgi:hypothetical protein
MFDNVLMIVDHVVCWLLIMLLDDYWQRVSTIPDHVFDDVWLVVWRCLNMCLMLFNYGFWRCLTICLMMFDNLTIVNRVFLYVDYVVWWLLTMCFKRWLITCFWWSWSWCVTMFLTMFDQVFVKWWLTIFVDEFWWCFDDVWLSCLMLCDVVFWQLLTMFFDILIV